MFASRKLRRTGTMLGVASLVLALAAAALAEDVKFSLWCTGSAHHPDALEDDFDVGPLWRDIAKDSNTRYWTPNLANESDWDDDEYSPSWHRAISGPQDAWLEAKSKSEAGLRGAGNEIVLDPRTEIERPEDLNGGSAHAFAWAGMGDYIVIPIFDPLVHMGIDGGMLGCHGSQWVSFANPTEIELPFPGNMPFQLDVAVTSQTLYPENIAQVTVEVLVDGQPIATGFAELTSGGMLYESGVLQGVFCTPMYEPEPGKLFSEFQFSLTLPEGWYVVPESCPGDLNGDGAVSLADLAQLLAHYGVTSEAAYEDGDMDGDGDVDLSDLAALLAVYGTSCWTEGFDDYDVGSGMHGQDGWKGWDNDPAFDALVTDVQACAPPNSVDVAGDADLVREFAACTSGQWTFTAWQYIPADFAADNQSPFDPGTYFLLLNTYDDGGPYNWSVQYVFDSNDGMLKVCYGNGHNTIDVPYITERWVKLQVDVDLDSDWTRIHYDGQLLTEYSWTGGIYGAGGGALEIGAVDLFANGSTSVYYDSLSLRRANAP
jgi:hypothetical protein